MFETHEFDSLSQHGDRHLPQQSRQCLRLLVEKRSQVHFPFAHIWTVILDMLTFFFAEHTGQKCTQVKADATRCIRVLPLRTVCFVMFHDVWITKYVFGLILEFPLPFRRYKHDSVDKISLSLNLTSLSSLEHLNHYKICKNKTASFTRSPELFFSIKLFLILWQT